MIRRVTLSLAAAALLVTGCPRGEDAKPPLDRLGTERQAAGEAPRASVALRVLVVNEPGVAEAINRLRGEWAEQSGGTLSATAAEWKEVSAAKNIDADAVVFPARYLGEFGTRGWLQPVRNSVLDSEAFNAGEVFPLVRRELVRWGSEVMVLPLGAVPIQAGISDKLHPGLDLLAEAAPRSESDGREGVLFDPRTMKPRISEPLFIDSLQRLAKAGAVKQATADDVRVVPVFGFADRMIGVTSSSRNAASAFKLIAWLASADVSSQLNAAGDRQISVRRKSGASTTGQETSPPSGDRADSSKSSEAAMNAERCLLVPRIPGVDEYMATLDEAVKSALDDKTSAQAALQKAAERWEQITEAHGRDAQRKAYLKHLQIRDE